MPPAGGGQGSQGVIPALDLHAQLLERMGHRCRLAVALPPSWMGFCRGWLRTRPGVRRAEQAPPVQQTRREGRPRRELQGPI